MSEETFREFQDRIKRLRELDDQIRRMRADIAITTALRKRKFYPSKVYQRYINWNLPGAYGL